MTERPLPDREQPLNVNLRRNPALSAISKTPGDGCGFTVWIDSHAGIEPEGPVRRPKHSGYGLEFGVERLKAVSEPQVITGTTQCLVI
jgi:hypothetical protein